MVNGTSIRATRRRAATLAALAMLAAGLSACGGTEPSGIASLDVMPASTLTAGVGSTVVFTPTARDESGSPVPAVGLTWRSEDETVAAVDPGGTATAMGAGITRITAAMDGVEASATLEVWVSDQVSAYLPGTSYEGRRGYVEYIPGELPVVISAPHGGDLTPVEIPDRTWGTVVTDSNTRETILAVRDAFVERTGRAPHVVISHLKRTKLDPNREIDEAAQESPFAENAWREFHGFVHIAGETVTEVYGAGLYLDLHGHGHPNNWVELGYLLSSSDLAQPDEVLDGQAYLQKSAIRALAEAVPLSFSELVRGTTSFGGLLIKEGVRAVPSPDDPSPAGEAYFSGGYNTRRHGSQASGPVSGIQLELPRPGIRDSDDNRSAFASRLVAVVEAYMNEHFGIALH